MSSSSTTASAGLHPDGDPLAEAERLMAEGRADQAAGLLDRAHSEGRGGLLLWVARVKARLALGEMASALALAREASQLFPGVALAACTLGEALAKNGRLAAAIAEYQRALRLDPNCAAARYGLGAAWLEAGEADKAADAFEALDPAYAPGDLAAKHDEIAQMRVRPRADPRYVRHLFDQFSRDYDTRMLGELHYSAPQMLRRMAELIGLSARAPLDILDLGCGTGLCGEIFADLAGRLDGVDLSPGMLDKAKARGVYDDLMLGDLETVLQAQGRNYDLILAADTLVYLGDLGKVFAGAAKRLSQDGVFLFTVERKDGGGFELGPKRRWRHSESYLRDLARVCGFDVAGFLDCEPRSEAGMPVGGYAVALAKG